MAKTIIRKQTEFGSKRWGIYVAGKLIEGGFFSREAAQRSAYADGYCDVYDDTPNESELSSRSRKMWA